MSPEELATQVCDNGTWVVVFRQLDHEVYGVETVGGEISLADYSTLEKLLRQQLTGGTHDGLGGGSVG